MHSYNLQTLNWHAEYVPAVLDMCCVCVYTIKITFLTQETELVCAFKINFWGYFSQLRNLKMHVVACVHGNNTKVFIVCIATYKLHLYPHNGSTVASSG